MTTIITSSSEIRNRPIDMPARSGMLTTSHGCPRSEANAVRELAQVLTRMPYQATQYDPPMPTIENSSTNISFGNGSIGCGARASLIAAPYFDQSSVETFSLTDVRNASRLS